MSDMIETATEMSDSINELAAALAQAQGQIQGARKDSTNPGLGNSKYADLASVWDACRGPLSANGLSVAQIPVVAPAGCVAVRSLLLHASGQWMGGTIQFPYSEANRGTNAAQAYGSALTYARRYALAALVGVAPEDDDAACTAGPTSRQGPSAKPVANAGNAGNGKAAASSKITTPDQAEGALKKLMQSKGFGPGEIMKACEWAHSELSDEEKMEVARGTFSDVREGNLKPGELIEAAGTSNSPPDSSTDPITSAQKRMIDALAAQAQVSINTEGMSRSAATRIIADLKTRLQGGQAA